MSFTLLDLSAAVDVYSDWVDACDAVAKTTANKYGQNESHGSGLPVSPKQGMGHGEVEVPYDDDNY
jgi:transcription elongation factor Elf1